MTDLHTIQSLARKIWDEREARFPPFARMKWEQGTPLARQAALAKAAQQRPAA